MGLLETYNEILQGIERVHENTPLAVMLGNRVTFRDNKTEPVHRWFTFKEGFSRFLLPEVIQHFGLHESRTLLDPFLGCGTSLLSWRESIRAEGLAVGVERNPFIRFAAEAKVNWPIYNPDVLIALSEQILAREPDAREIADEEIPILSTLRNTDIFEREIIKKLISYHRLILKIAGGRPECNALLLGWASIIERLSNVRKDGRALRRIVRVNKPSVAEALRGAWTSIAEDILVHRRSYPCVTPATVLSGDARTLVPLLRENDVQPADGFDLVFYSPPYLNNFDYTEVYKMELWMSGFVTSQEGFKQQRLLTLRSHPSISFPATNSVIEEKAHWGMVLREELSAAATRLTRRVAQTQRTFSGYIDDMYKSLQEQYQVCANGGHVVCVVANSVHGTKENLVPIATDLIIAGLAMDVGFTVSDLIICRNMTRRVQLASNLYRESIVVMRK